MLPALRKPSTWILLLALVVLAACVLWLLPRLLEPPPPPATNIAGSGETTGAPEPLSGAAGDTGAGAASAPPAGETADATIGAGERAEGERAGPGASAEPDDRLPAPGRISGRVVDAAGRPVADALVLALHAADVGTPIDERSWWIAHLPLDVADPVALGAETPASSTTDAQGEFAFEPIEPGRVRLAVRSTNHDPLDREDLWLPAGGALRLEKLRVEPPSRLSGRVLDPDGVRVAGASIVRVDDFAQAGLARLSARAGALLATTNLGGAFETLPVGIGPTTYVVTGGTRFPDVEIALPSAREGRGIEATLGEGARIRGRVRSSTRLPEAMVVRALPASPRSTGPASIPFACRGDGRTAKVFPNGDFELTGLVPGIVHELRVGEVRRPWEVDSAWSPPVLVAADEERAELLWDPDASVVLRVLAAGTGQPIDACLATITGFDPPTAPVAGASAAIQGLRPLRTASFRGLSISKDGYLDAWRDLKDLLPGRTLELGDVELSAVPAITVRVVDAATESPIADAEVRAVDTPIEIEDPEFAFRTTTDAAGVARIRSFGGAGSGIEIRARGYAPARRQGPFGAGYRSAELTIGLSRGATVSVRIVDNAGDAVPAARIEHVEGSWSPNEAWGHPEVVALGVRPDPRASRVADARGEATFRHLAPGRHAFRLQRYRGYADSEWTLRELGEGDAQQIVLVTQPPAALDVRVQDGGVLLAGAAVALLRVEDGCDPVALLDPRTPLPPCLTAKLDSMGMARFENVAPGGFVLLVRVPGQSLRAYHELALQDGGSRVEVDRARSSIVGTVVHAQSGPIEGAEIHLASFDRRDSGRSSSRILDLGLHGAAGLLASGCEIAATTTDERGAYRIVGLPRDERFLVIARSGAYWRRGSGPVSLAPDGAETRADLELLHAGAIEVRLGTRPTIVPCVVAAVSYEFRALPRIAPAFSGGVVSFDALPQGRWMLLVDGVRDDHHEAVDVVAGETTYVDLAVP